MCVQVRAQMTEVPERTQRRKDPQEPEGREEHPDFDVGTQKNPPDVFSLS